MLNEISPLRLTVQCSMLQQSTDSLLTNQISLITNILSYIYVATLLPLRVI